MGFLDLIKKGVVEEFTGTISTGDLFFSLLTAFITAVFITYVYKKTYTGVSYTKSFALSIILLAMVTSLVIRTINSNLALSLGMVGALSIVRFRTAVKDPVDTVFMFWAIAAGIMSGAGLYIITMTASLLLGIFYVISYSAVFKSAHKYLLVINIGKDHLDEIMKEFEGQKNCILKTESVKKDKVELTYEINGKEATESISKYKDNKNIESIHLINID
jgi:ABC-type spermidine/putrescine transport system, permease component II